MLFEKFPKNEKEYYEKMLFSVCSLSKLFSQSSIPYLDSRIAENLFCKSFCSKNVSRDDASVDAVFGKIGIGIKTFQGGTLQKIAEFNKDLSSFNGLNDLDKVKRIAELRNARLEATKRIYGLDELLYHCVRRSNGKVFICEYPMDLIDISKIKTVKRQKNSLSFSDAKNEYCFHISKSVLFEKFKDNQKSLLELKIKLVEDPFELIEKISTIKIKYSDEQGKESIMLPLYTIIGDNKMVPERSGLNQWNAGGRKRNYDEIYIPIPAWINKTFVKFFPPRDKPFKLNLPDGKVLSAKVCQDNNKALMTNPNKALGQWLLRDILQLKTNELATYDKLKKIGVDSVIIKKINDREYAIDFREIGAFENFSNN